MDLNKLDRLTQGQTLTDDDPMPFGQKYKGVRLGDVPVEYLEWVYDNVKESSCPALFKYLDSRDDLFEGEDDESLSDFLSQPSKHSWHDCPKQHWDDSNDPAPF